MRPDAIVFDADRHVIEPFDMWPRYLDPAFRDEAPTLVPDAGDVPGETIAARMQRLGPAGMTPLMPIPCWRGRPIWRPMPEAMRLAASRGSWTRLGAMHEASVGAGQLASMDRQGVAAAALMPTYATFLIGTDDMPPPVAHAFAAAYNRWLADLCAADPQRLLPVGLIARHDPSRMVVDLEAVLARGWRAVVMRPEPVGGRTLGHPDLAPFWARCAEAGLPVMLHGGTHARVPAAGTDRFDSQFARHACAHGLEAMMALVALIDGGVLARHPTLRVGLLEAGCSWLPHWLWRLDASWSVATDDLRRRVPDPPSSLIRRACVLGFEPGEPLLAEAVDALGSAPFVFGTDFPHFDHDTGLVQQAAALEARVGSAAFARLMGGNAAAWFGWRGAQAQEQENGSASSVSQ